MSNSFLVVYATEWWIAFSLELSNHFKLSSQVRSCPRGFHLFQPVAVHSEGFCWCRYFLFQTDFWICDTAQHPLTVFESIFVPERQGKSVFEIVFCANETKTVNENGALLSPLRYLRSHERDVLHCIHSSLKLLVLLGIHSVFLVIRLHSFQQIFMQSLRVVAVGLLPNCLRVEYQVTEIAWNYTKDTCHRGGVHQKTHSYPICQQMHLSRLCNYLSSFVEFSVILK